MIIASQDWDGTTAPGLPAGWYFDLGFATTQTRVAPWSSPNSLITAGAGVDQVAYYQTPDGVSGQVRVTAAFTAYGGNSGYGTPDARGAVFARASNPNPANGATCYRASIALDQGTVTLARYQAGNAETLAIVGGSFIGPYASAGGTWFNLHLICNGIALAVNVQRLSDGQWLQTNGLWGASQVNCLSATDGSISGSGYAGLVLYNDANGPEGASLSDAATDNFLFESLVDSRPEAIVVPAGWVERD